ncbi:fused MFS/spermidine synthase [Polaromonas sp.]|uniref:fused MFS/spermidine synthase n=1 Tax=Polaromonas sp. TaxID=1869339 RepID=UPI0017C87C0F|nr:fused MFS/spermidine synthase [Polaromonas sp.]NMM07571.1 fused MFS/spermidine synthase [Polaromonas sp.]
MKADVATSPDSALMAPAQPGDFLSLQFVQPFVRNDGAAKSLHFTLGELQSRMLTRMPWRLEVDYTRTMMGFLLFRPAPVHICMIGLGGGSLAKFCYRQLPASKMTVLEINPYVIALRREFQIPDDDERFTVVAADGALYLQNAQGENPDFDVLLVDGFDQEGQPPALCSQRFYDDCFAALAEGGVLAVNLHYDHPDYPVLADRISRSFGGNAVEVLAEEKSNAIVFASKGQAISPRNMSLPHSLAGLDQAARMQLKGELVRIAWEMKNLDQHGLA